jgi:hypothetical protein
MTLDPLTSDRRSAEIVRGDVSGGTNTSHTIVVGALTALLDAVPMAAPPAAYERAALEANDWLRRCERRLLLEARLSGKGSGVWISPTATMRRSQ